MPKQGPGGAAIGGMGTLLLIAALATTAYQFRAEGPDIIGVLIAVVCWVLGIACYMMRWRD